MIELTPDETHYEKYLDVAMMLLSSPDEVSPSARALVERLGGSLTTANKAMQVFWRYVGRRLAYQQQYPQGMPGPIIKLTEQLMASAREAAAQELEEEKTRLVQREQKMLEQAASLEATIDCQQQALAQANETRAPGAFIGTGDRCCYHRWRAQSPCPHLAGAAANPIRLGGCHGLLPA